MAYSDIVLATAGLNGYWQQNEPSGSAVDSSAGGNTGTYTGSPTLGVVGFLPVTTAVLYDGSTQWVNIAATAAMNTTDTFSAEAWILRSRTSVGTAETIFAAESSPNRFFQLYFPAGSNIPTLRKNGVQDLVASTVAITDTGRWHHIVATKATTTLKFYVDGIDSTGVVNNSAITAGSALLGASIGCFYNGSVTSNFTGATIAQVAYYTTALNPADVAAHYAAGLPLAFRPHRMPLGV